MSLSRPAAVSVDAWHAFRVSLIVVSLIKLVLALLIPLTGDEAYFIQWGRELAGSYYDHGPVTGWWIWLTLLPGDYLWLVRLPAVAASPFVAWILWRVLRPVDSDRALWAATLFLWSPVSLLSVLMTTDVPLLYLAALSVATAVRAHASQRPLDYVLAGAWLGLAFLAKYFAVLIGFAFAVWWLALSGRPRISAVLWLLLGAAPFIAQHLYWNYHHSWVNVVFNLFTRQEDHGLNWTGPLLFLAVASYLLAPVVVSLLRRRQGLLPWSDYWRQLRTQPVGVAVAAFAIPYLVLFVVSFRSEIGVHWLLAFYPFAFAALALAVPPERLRSLLRPLRTFSGAHAAIVAVLAFVPTELVRSHKSYASIVLGSHPDAVVAALEPYLDRYRVTTPSYAKSALLDFYLPGTVSVLGVGSFHGRQDDLRTDFRELAGDDILVLTDKRRQAEESAAWFEQAELQELEVRGARLYLLLGHGFRYPEYRDTVLRTIAERYYRMPEWLARFSSGDFFRQRYDLEAPSR